MIGLVYICKGKIKGYTFPVKERGTPKDQMAFIKDMIEEGRGQEGNIVPEGNAHGSWACIVFDDKGKPTWNYQYENLEGKLFKAHVEQTEGA